jgi:hypothetical protein
MCNPNLDFPNQLRIGLQIEYIIRFIYLRNLNQPFTSILKKTISRCTCFWRITAHLQQRYNLQAHLEMVIILDI